MYCFWMNPDLDKGANKFNTCRYTNSVSSIFVLMFRQQ